MATYDSINTQAQGAVRDTNKMIRNTYMLLAMTMVFSTVTAVISMAINPPFIVYLGSIIVSFIMLFVINKKQNTAAALPLTFLFTGLMGFGLGPILNSYLALPNGGQIVATALGMTAVTFFGLTGYVMSSRRDFSFMGGFLAAGSIVLIVAMLAMFILPLFGVDVSGMQLAFSAAVVFLMAGFLLYDTSNIINGTYTNYIMATVGLYLNVYNLFVHLLSLVGAFNDD
ncbi:MULTISPECIES: Bax inhibitor-1/YccA family protein [unclassified Marinobacterium]|jgi:modulator of FtsH protease|uniref:Bax inhibitor-1/YccA family protein n=1 Tax=unclassified Marinobacterium TaxID=2644139 RepID=UPI00156A3FCE|nr:MULTISPECIES: Bax inhibitor-1/YccA family protein [unclassified Marinobacterium]NRP10540.1 Modulator of FtsH protease YccA [Marinobacterium sp. xm-g-48]NRP15795.1 Modulator of FtsH protease YccA [Marinobacterium sp. xm-a-152]NRP27605.1 Modulator of FtsH protease YccA [Marinobacterium sp. xm-d-420]NRP36030.1 Modulator of FtsH protease YccA [Marinobacterium sp. xm-d-579]NRP38811.1 Modulator of FtsH protease YccA [Marinobacterium sp. xm-a-121]